MVAQGLPEVPTKKGPTRRLPEDLTNILIICGGSSNNDKRGTLLTPPNKDIITYFMPFVNKKINNLLYCIFLLTLAPNYGIIRSIEEWSLFLLCQCRTKVVGLPLKRDTTLSPNKLKTVQAVMPPDPKWNKLAEFVKGTVKTLPTATTIPRTTVKAIWLCNPKARTAPTQ